MENLHSNITEATAKVIKQIVSGQVPSYINREMAVTSEENDKAIPSDDLGPETIACCSTLQEPDEQPSKYVRLNAVSDKYLQDLMPASAPFSTAEEAENKNWLEEHMEDLKNHFVEELTTIQQEINCPYTIDDESSFEEESTFMPPRFDGKEEESCESTENADHKPLYEGARITVGVSVLLILTVAIRHSLTGEALNDILCLISLHCLSPNLCPKTLFQLKRYFHDVTKPNRLPLLLCWLFGENPR